MVKRATTLIIEDTELECNCKETKLEDINITHIGLSQNVLDQFDLILYNGSKGTKLMKSKFTKTGIIG